MRYQSTYIWLIFLSSLDIMLTWIVLYRGGREVNGLADFIIHRSGLVGLVAFKFSLVVFVILICESIGRRTELLGRRFAQGCIAIAVIPIAVAFIQLLAHH